jgi:small subunit ribosomal protein S9
VIFDDEPRDEQSESESEGEAQEPAAEQQPGRNEQEPAPEEQPDADSQEPAAEEQPDADSQEPAAEEQPESDEPEPAAAQEATPESSEQPSEGQPAAEEKASSEESGAKAKGSKRSDTDDKTPPGAELEPIKIEPQRELSAEERARVEAEAEERARAEAEATAEAGEEPGPAREPAVELAAEARIQATGKRKSSIARVVLRSGSGSFEINRRGLEDYFPRHQHQTFVRQPLITSGYEGKVDVRVRVHGGGIAGQAGAVRHGIARALTEIDPELRGELKRRGLLTRDARAKERRKAGLKKARKRPQFSKR